MPDSDDNVAQALFESLIDAPPLLADLPEACLFSTQDLILPTDSQQINSEQKLGHLYEDILAGLLENTPRYCTLEKSLQLREETGRTLGELDFLLQDARTGNFIHLELAVKFYLAVDSDEALLLPGPDARDNYYRKLGKMRSHQLALTENFHHLLPEIVRVQEIVVQQLVHGCIFDHIHADRLAKAEFLHPKGRRGKWLHVEECERYFGSDADLELIPKYLWPVPLNKLDGIPLEKWQPDMQLERCVMVRARDAKNVDSSPYFIAPTGYPQL